MKQTNKLFVRVSQVGKPRKLSSKAMAARRKIRTRRPLHKHVALHPITVFALLCVGVLLATYTLNAVADSYTVNAVVPADALTVPAVITSPTDGTQTSIEALTVSGTCPDNSYVDLTDNGSFAGTYDCAGNTFQIGLDLSSGDNQLQAQDYNNTNTAGPASVPITVTYTPPPAPPVSQTSQMSSVPQSSISNTTIATPEQLVVTQVDLSVPYVQSITPIISYQPTIAGIAPPYSHIVIVFHTNPYTCVTNADAQGYWSCTLPATLPATTHTVDVTATTPQGQVLVNPPFKVKVVASGPSNVPTPSPFHITSSYTYTMHNIGQVASYAIHIIGGNAPYAFTVLWGDGSSATIIRQTGDDFTISHAYKGRFSGAIESKIIKVQAVDPSGQSSTLQLSALIRNPAYHGLIAGTAKPTSPWSWFINTIRPWLWILWPGYIIILLLVFSFWLGERQEFAVLMDQQRIAAGRRHTHAHR
jgi:hypothetical protein